MLACLACISCASETVKPQPKQPELAANDTPRHAIQRFIGAYEQRKAAEFKDMLTEDFAFEFSNSTDPDLVTKYAAGWFKSDEDTAALHLFQGYTPQGQPHTPAASSINIDFASTTAVDDNSPGVDPVTHKFVATRVDGQIVIPTSPDPTSALIENNYNVFYLVRGDLAVLGSGQAADSLHWYVHHWKDLTTATGLPGAPSGESTPLPTRSKTWAGIRAGFR